MRYPALLLVLAAILCGPAAAMHYDVAVGIRPEAHRLDATVIIRDPVGLRFSLHKNLVLQSVIADGKLVAFHFDTAAKASPFAPDAVVVVIETKSAKVLELRYGGVLDTTISGVAQIKPELVELAIPFAWYPFYSLAQNFTFRLTAALPEGLTVAANGKLLSEATVGGRTSYLWESYEPAFDLALVAAPGMHKTIAGSPPVELDYAMLPPTVMENLRDALVRARTRLVALFGEPCAKIGLQVFFAPRRGYPYARAPLVLTSEGYVSKDLGGDAVENFRHTAHELAHHWWIIAPAVNAEEWTANSEAWLNEGLAEYSAILMVQDEYGEAAARKILDGYRTEAARSKTSDAIAETKQTSPDAFLNRYKKASLMLFAARAKFGGVGVDTLLKSLYRRYAGTQGATTKAFIEQVRTSMGEEAAVFFQGELFRHPTVSPSNPTQQNG